eukprot:6178682-Pleurochrysis_carterae.AAC.1
MAPAAHACPRGQGVHCRELSRPVSLLKVAEGQSRGTELPGGQKLPAGHGIGLVVASVGQKVPPGQGPAQKGLPCSNSDGEPR